MASAAIIINNNPKMAPFADKKISSTADKLEVPIKIFNVHSNYLVWIACSQSWNNHLGRHHTLGWKKSSIGQSFEKLNKRKRAYIISFFFLFFIYGVGR